MAELSINVSLKQLRGWGCLEFTGVNFNRICVWQGGGGIQLNRRFKETLNKAKF